MDSGSNRISSFKHAIHGIYLVFKSQVNFKIQLACAIIAIVLGFALSISIMEWVVIIIVSGLVLSLETFNTSIELLSDKIERNYSEEIKMVKDVAAGAVLLASITAAVIGGIIFLPKILSYFDWI